MNIMIFELASSCLGRKTLCASVVLGIALFAFAGDVFAAPVLIPTMVTQVTGDSAILVGHVSNLGKVSSVWFEVSDGVSSSPTVVGMSSVFNEGSFQWSLANLTPGTAYQYRAAAMEGGVIAYSPMASFKTIALKPASSVATQSSSVSQGAGSSGNTDQTQSKTQASNTNSKSANNTAVANAVKKTASSAVLAGSNTYTSISGLNSNSAAVVGMGNSIFPTTLIGWVMLLLSVIAAVLVGRMIFESSEKRKKLA